VLLFQINATSITRSMVAVTATAHNLAIQLSTQAAALIPPPPTPFLGRSTPEGLSLPLALPAAASDLWQFIQGYISRNYALEEEEEEE